VLVDFDQKSKKFLFSNAVPWQHAAYLELVRMEAVFENENFLLFVKQSNYRQSNE